MAQVLKQADRVAQGFAADPVHDLRVALRRCRSMGEGIRAIDPDSSWKKMRRMAKELFASLGMLRDCHVLMEWMERLGTADDPVLPAFLEYCRAQEEPLKQHVEAALQQFDRRQWRSWVRSLARRAAPLRPGSEPFRSLALERWMRARRLHNQAMRRGLPADFHRLRIGLKKFRYVVENFLPAQHQAWGEGLKHSQDLLGEIHDLDVLQAALIGAGVLNVDEARRRWEERVGHARAARVDEYRRMTTGPESLWLVWRQGLPHGSDARHAAFKRIQAWASFLDPDVEHSRRVGRLALQLYDGLNRAGLLGRNNTHTRELLQAAATVHEVGRSDGSRGHHKTTQRLVQKVDRPVSWTQRDLDVIAYVARFHRGSLPGKRQSGLLQGVPASLRHQAQSLAGVLRLASALDAGHDGVIRRLRVSRPGGFAVVQAEGLDSRGNLAETIAGARHLLELSCGVPILVRPLAQHTRHRLKANTMNAIQEV
jgi:CHAD domain-containing protein